MVKALGVERRSDGNPSSSVVSSGLQATCSPLLIALPYKRAVARSRARTTLCKAAALWQSSQMSQLAPDCSHQVELREENTYSFGRHNS